MNFVVAGSDPREFGLPMDNQTYAQMFKLMISNRTSEGVGLCWKEISCELRGSLDKDFHGVFMLSGSVAEREYLTRIATGEIDVALIRNRSHLREALARYKFIARTRMPRLYSIYSFIANSIRNVLP
jgi:hypothetical protein